MNSYPGPNSVLVCDNAKVHKGRRVQQLCDEKGVMLIFLPPYCPELNPIELCFAAIKSCLRKSQAMSLTSDPEWEVQQTAAEVMSRDLCSSLYQHCGYNMPFKPCTPDSSTDTPSLDAVSSAPDDSQPDLPYSPT